LTTAVGKDTFPCDWSMGPESRDFAEDTRSARAIATVASHFGGALYSDLLAHGLSHFFPSARLEANGRPAVTHTALVCDCNGNGDDGCGVAFEWLASLRASQSQSGR
jgi:hypothetical protein